MESKLDIGIGFDDLLETFIPRQSLIGYEKNNHIKVSNVAGEPLLLSVYEGVCIQTKYNRLMRTFELQNARNGIFLIQMKLLEENGKLFVRVMSDNIILDDLECCSEPDIWLKKTCKEDDDKREWVNARNSFIEFVDNAIQLVNDPDVKPHIRDVLQTTEDHIYFEEMKKRLNDANKVIETCDDVTKDEYSMMLEEISEIVNPFISKIQMIVKREKIVYDK